MTCYNENYDSRLVVRSGRYSGRKKGLTIVTMLGWILVMVQMDLATLEP